MAEEFSPEEKLLRLIRGEKKHKDKPALKKVEPSKSPTEMPLTGTADTKNKPPSMRTAPDEWRHFKFVNSALIILLILTVAFFIFDFVGPKLRQFVTVPPYESQITNHELPPATHELPPVTREPRRADHETQATPFSTYAEIIGKRELFKPRKSEAERKRISGERVETAHDKLKDLSLIGIIAGERPQAVIEDKKNKKTYFLYKGQIVNQLKLESILEDRVILDFEGEKLQLVL